MTLVSLFRRSTVLQEIRRASHEGDLTLSFIGPCRRRVDGYEMSSVYMGDGPEHGFSIRMGISSVDVSWWKDGVPQPRCAAGREEPPMAESDDPFPDQTANSEVFEVP